MLTMPVELPEPQLKPHTDIVLRKRYLHKSLDGATVETPRDLFWRVAASVAESERAYPASPYAPEQLAREFYDLEHLWADAEECDIQFDAPAEGGANE